MTARWTLIGVLVPVLGLAALVGRAEYATRHAAKFTIPIQGFDPRDLLHGQYLNYQYRLRWVGPHTCGDPDHPDPVPHPTRGCCVCLTRSGADGFDPFARQMTCDSPGAGCEAIVRADTMVPPLRYFVPEDSAAGLEAALRNHDAAVEVNEAPGQGLAVGALLLDRRPWRDVVP